MWPCEDQPGSKLQIQSPGSIVIPFRVLPQPFLGGQPVIEEGEMETSVAGEEDKGLWVEANKVNVIENSGRIV